MESQTQPVLTVSELTHAIKLYLENSFPHILLQGEVSNLKLQSSGHLYFTLKDENAQISAVMFRGDAASLKIMPKAGDHVIIRGEINVYPPKGNYQIIVRELKPLGLGALLLKLEELKAKLQQKGWFDPANKKPLPKIPKTIGVVTSPTGAVIQDILNVLKRRAANFHLILNPVKVQGEGAAFEIARAIQDFNTHKLVDLIIVARGGGTLEDLWAFNEEIVASAIFHSQIPIISAIGHETDFTIADFVSDVRAPTPSAAAEIAIAEKTQQMETLVHHQKRISQSMTHLLRSYRHELKAIERQPMLLSPYTMLGAWIQKVDDLRLDLTISLEQRFKRLHMTLDGLHREAQAFKPINQIARYRERFFYLDKSIQNSLKTKRERLREQVKNMGSKLALIDPKNLLRQGYSILFSEKDKSVINSVRLVKEEDRVRLLLSDGELNLTVNSLQEKVLL